MAVARDSDFLGEGTADQGTARPLTLAEQARLEEERRQRRLLQQGAATAGINSRPGGYNSQRAADDRDALRQNRQSVFSERIARTGSARGDRDSLLENLSQDPVTTSILLGPLAVTTAGLAVGGPSALGFGEGASSLTGAPGIAFKDSAAPTIARTASSMPAGIGTPGAGAAASPPAASSAVAPGAAAAGGWTTKDTIQSLLPIGTAGLSVGLEKMLFGGQSKEQKALKAQQEKLAQEAELRREQTQQARMQALGQRVLAFNPHNQLMAQMFGPQAAFSPEQLAGMAANPMEPAIDPELINYTGTDKKVQARVEESIRKKQEFERQEKERREMLMGGLSPLPQGPTPIQMPAPQAARRY